MTMAIKTPTVLALDFDGVLCNGLIEYFQTAWRTYSQIWQISDEVPLNDLMAKFYRLRPVIEIGWEMPLLIRALILGIEEDTIFQEWQAIAEKIVIQENLDRWKIGACLDNTRDEWIVEDLEGWLSLHQFYPGVVEKLKELMVSEVKPIIITTKEGRFARSLLHKVGVNLPEADIIGKESKRPKYETLKILLAKLGARTTIWFLEDRLKTLLSIQKHPDLQEVELFLADWGYNTQKERDSVAKYPSIHLLSSAQFCQDFSKWKFGGKKE
ncbi:MAG: HAD family hydrolase [Trichodesmium sp. St16_bin4-tuft]|nr:HAD family hydrolase [Trichodesmium sp. MAG_R01]MDE5074343.1 HAD family hydrolase [Trichodesmium sp. St5_bin8]MDE5077475.1 HAD family hydrolase [Trichodesmium sp. St2_bin6]MDE5098102.1 HAD family hydrolase [Trichodesmium sp. St16_bin4-tuft]MDE5101747.1 HAD family hydrolase [Trichodesmium sp. St19_bin2]